jgi:hypothetical protein
LQQRVARHLLHLTQQHLAKELRHLTQYHFTDFQLPTTAFL